MDKSTSISFPSIEIWSIEAFCMPAINCYILISGYFCWKQRFRLSKSVRLIGMAIFYASVIYAILVIIKIEHFSVLRIIKILFPISYQEYWFLTPYIGIYLLSPMIRKMLNNLTQTQHRNLIIICVFLFSLTGDIIPLSYSFGVNAGYSIIWFVVVYITGAYFGRYDVEVVSKKIILAYVLSIFGLIVSWIVLTLFSNKFSYISNNGLTSYYFRYSSMLVYIASVSLFLIFLRKIHISNLLACKFINFASTLTFGIYLLHDNKNIRDVLWYTILKYNEISIGVTIIFCELLSAIMIFILAGVIEWIRQEVVKKSIMQFNIYRKIICKIDNLGNKIWQVYE